MAVSMSEIQEEISRIVNLRIDEWSKAEGQPIAIANEQIGKLITDSRALFTRDAGTQEKIAALAEKTTALDASVAAVLRDGQKLMDDIQKTSGDLEKSNISITTAIKGEFDRVELLVKNVDEVQKQTGSDQARLLALLSSQSEMVMAKTDEAKATACNAIAEMEQKVRGFCGH